VAGRSAADRDDLHEVVQTVEIIGVTRVQGELDGERSCGDEQIEGAPTACLATRRQNSRVDPPVCARGRRIEGEDFEGGLGSLESILPPRTLLRICAHVRSGSEFRQRDGRDRHLDRQLTGIDLVEIDDDARIREAARMPGIRHAASDPGRPVRRGRAGSSQSRSAARPGRR
jgi:hypothetical protein